MNEDLHITDRRVIPHIYSRRRIEQEIINLQSAISYTESNIMMHANNYYDFRGRTSREFFENVTIETINELRARSVPQNITDLRDIASWENDRERLIVELDRLIKLRNAINEFRAILMVIRYNRSNRRQRRRLNTYSLAENGYTFIEMIRRTMPDNPTYFPGLRIVTPLDNESQVTFDTVDYHRYRLVGGNRISLFGLIPERFVNPVFVATGRMVDEAVPTTSISTVPDDTKVRVENADVTPGPINAETKETSPTIIDNSQNIDFQTIFEIVSSLRDFSEDEQLDNSQAEVLSSLLNEFDNYNNANYHGVLQDVYHEALANTNEEEFLEHVSRLRGMLINYEDESQAARERNVLILQNASMPTTSAGSYEFETIRSLCIEIMNTRFSRSNDRINALENLLNRYEGYRTNPETRDIIRLLNTETNGALDRKVQRFGVRINEYRRSRLPDYTEVSDIDRLRELMRGIPDGAEVLFNTDVRAFDRMAQVVELYHELNASRRFAESPRMRVGESGTLTRNELRKLKDILQTYRTIYANPTIREAFLHGPNHQR